LYTDVYAEEEAMTDEAVRLFLLLGIAVGGIMQAAGFALLFSQRRKRRNPPEKKP
jgi:hypothetical protein